MEKSKLLAGFVFIFLVQSPLVLAITCNLVSPANYNQCIEILNSGIAENESELLISNLEYSNRFFPDHEYIFDRNSNSDVTNAPVGVKTYDKEFIKSAWADIFALMPSVIYKEVLYVPENTSILTGYNSNIKIPENYYSSNYPQTSQGDCKRIYSLNKNEAENRVYVNEDYFGDGDFVDLSIKKDSEISIEYYINVEVEIKHYSWVRYCSSRKSDGSCRKYSEKCSYFNTETKKEDINIKDSVKVNLYKNALIADIDPVNSYNGATKLKLNYSDSITVSFNDSAYLFNKYIYSINYSKAPYYVNTLKAENYNQEKLSNLFKEGDSIIVKNTDNCKIKSFDFFNVVEKNCNSETENIDFFIKTDKLKYDKGENIHVSIFPNNISIKISYGGDTRIALGYADFTADYHNNLIIAEYNVLNADKVIFVGDKNKLIIIWNLIIFTFLNYFLYVLLKHCFKKLK
jgi:hypothetical protein